MQQAIHPIVRVCLCLVPLNFYLRNVVVEYYFC
jgi:hypothetical protein